MPSKSNDPFLQAAIDEAKEGLAEGGIPIGSVLVIDGEIVGRGHNRRVQNGSAILHAEMDAIEIDPDGVRRYLQSKFGDDRDRGRKAMQKLAKAFKPKELAEVAFHLYEQFRPAIREGVKGWGAKGDLDLGLIESLAERG